ncbi:hypothetical protein OG985_21595 [Streptomyces sp. NBC_00289]|uniref:hypothetical protein n=1 Tax=Streptomyces sp. NBC_00289 TaxID=2975703 RepID=UPI0032563359
MNTPLDTFLSDQALATGRDLAAGGTPTVVILPAAGACTWCDCDVLAKAHDPRFCAGCPNGAALVLVVYSADPTEQPQRIVLCEGHKHEAMQFLTAIIAAGGFQ